VLVLVVVLGCCRLRNKFEDDDEDEDDYDMKERVSAIWSFN
jgi:hypothetical protein